MRILVTGSRHWTDRRAIYQALNQVVWDKFGQPSEENMIPGVGQVTLVHGACPTGADLIADDWAVGNWFQVEAHPADWGTHGRGGGPIRNQEMVDLGADVVVAFPLGVSRGTRDCIAKAQAAGLPVIVREGTPR